MQDGDAARQLETRLAGVTGIEIKRAANRFAKRLVRVAEDNHVRSLANDTALDGLGRFARVNDVVHEEFAAIEFSDFRFLEIESDNIGNPISPPWSIWSTPAKSFGIFGSKCPCVSEMAPIFITCGWSVVSGQSASLARGQ